MTRPTLSSHLATFLSSSALASFLMEFARFDITAIFPFTYPRAGMILSSEGELNVDVASPRKMGIPRTGQTSGIRMSSSVMLNGKLNFLARCLAAYHRCFSGLSFAHRRWFSLHQSRLFRRHSLTRSTFASRLVW